MDDESAIVDDRLRLIFTCCHPALGMPLHVALTLRALGGLTTGEIARAFLVAEPTMGKRIVRAKRKIADAHISLPRAGRRGAPRPASRRAAGGVPDLQRGLRGDGGRSARPRRALRRGDPPRRAAVAADARRRRGLGAAGVDAAARRAPRRPCGSGGRYVALDEQDRSLWIRTGSTRAWRGWSARRACGAPASTSCRPPSPPCRCRPERRRHRLGADRRAVRRARGPQPVAGGRAQPRGRRRPGLGARRRPGAARTAARRPGARALPAAARRTPSCSAARATPRAPRAHTSGRSRSPPTPSSARSSSGAWARCADGSSEPVQIALPGATSCRATHRPARGATTSPHA